MKTTIEEPRLTISQRTRRVKSGPPKIASILVPLDFSNSSAKALKYATALANQFGAKLIPMFVIELPDVVGMSQLLLDDDETRDALSSKLLKFARKELVPPTLIDHTVVRKGRPHHEIAEAARTLHCDLIVISTHSGMNRVLLGSVTERVVREAPCPVLVVRENEHDFVGQ